MTDISSYIDAHLDENLDLLTRYVAFPSISAQKQAIPETAAFVKEMLESIGASATVFEKEAPGHPVVIGELPGRSSYTLLLYNHYDVQPPEPLELWTTPPFEVRRDGDRMFGRGISDNKGTLVSRLMAVRALQEAHGGTLPVTIKFIVEGDEEVGSPRLLQFMQLHRESLSADVALQEGGGVGPSGRPNITLGVKGVMTCSLRITTANRDVHSSSAAVNQSAAWRLIWALSTIKDKDDYVLIPGFYDDVREPTMAEVDLLRALPAEEERSLRSMEMKDFIGGVRGLEYQKRLAFSPTCTINGMGSGYQGRGTKTIVPAQSFAKMDFRLVPDQDPKDILAKLKKHLLDQGFDDVVINAGDGEYPARFDPTDPFVEVVRSTARDVYGQEPLLLPSAGGTQPLHPISHTLGVPIASAGIGHPDGRAHAPDENISVTSFVQGTKHLAAIIERLGEQYG